jgi:predicted nucleic acid-binding protein
MSDYIVDASVVIQRLIQDRHTRHVKALFNRLTASGNLIIPEFCIIECVNVLWKQVRFQGMPQDRAENLINDLIALPLHIAPVTMLLRRALQIGAAHQLAVYDSVYIALAEQLGHPLITADERQSKVAHNVGITLQPLTDFTPSE